MMNVKLNNAQVLLVDDDPFLLKTAELLLKSSYQIHTATSVAQGKAILHNHQIDVLVCDLNFEGHEQDGLNLMDWIMDHYPKVPIIVLSGDPTTERVVGAMRRGPVNFVPKSGDYESDLRAAIESGVILRSNSIEASSRGFKFKTRSLKVEKLLQMVDQIVRSGSCSPILITGESGTGKEFLAKHIASAFNKPLVTANMASIGKETAESELFGHVKGSFTGAHTDKIGLIENAHRGIFFLDELGDCTLAVQAKLLRTIQEGEIRKFGDTQTKKIVVQFVAATNKDLLKMIDTNEFRLDLYQRLATFTLEIPPLRERPEDIQLYLTSLFKEYDEGNSFSIQASGLEVLLSYRWPGNVRELRNFVERVVVLSKRRILDESTVKQYLSAAPTKEIPLRTSHSHEVRLQILNALEITQGNRTHAAALLQIDPSTLFRQMKKFGITVAATPGRPQKTLKT